MFTGLSSAVLAWALVRDGAWRLWTFCSVPLWQVLVLGQWAPLVMAGAILPALGFTLAAKPTLGLRSLLAPILANRGRRTRLLRALLAASSNLAP
jgi:hypothetical protein